MEHLAVNSSQIASLAHDIATARLQVLFRRGGLYEYSDVTADEFNQVLNPGPEHSSSIGVAFGKVIKGRKPSQKLEGQPWPAVAANEPANNRVETPAPEPAPVPAEVQVVSRKSTELTTQAEQIAVTDADSQTRASEALLAIAAMRKEIADTFKPMKDAAFKAHRTICDQERALDAPLASAEIIVKRRIGEFVQEQQRLAREAEEQLRLEARRIADEQARRIADEQAIEQAEELAARGNMAAAEAVLSNPAPVAVPYIAPAPVAPAVADVKGVGVRMEWDFRIVDINLVPREYMLVNETAIRQVVKATKGKVRIAGIEPFEKPVVSASRRG